MIKYYSDKDTITLKLSEAAPLGSFMAMGSVLMFTTTMDYKSQTLEGKKKLSELMINLIREDLKQYEFPEGINETEE